MEETPKQEQPVPGRVPSMVPGVDMKEVKVLKRKRLKAILEFARTQVYSSQNEVCDWLYAQGLGCNQAQLSKDMFKLGLVPYVDRGGQKHLGRRNFIIGEQLEERYVKIFQEASLRVCNLGDKVLIETVPGCAQAVATIVESAGWVEVIGIYYGMSSVTVQCTNEDAADSIYDRVREGIL